MISERSKESEGLPDHPGRLIENDRRNRDTELIGRFQVDDQVELCRPLHGQVRRLGAFEDFVHLCEGRAAAGAGFYR